MRVYGVVLVLYATVRPDCAMPYAQCSADIVAPLALVCLSRLPVCLQMRLYTMGHLSFGSIELFVTSACARRTGATSQAFERMHNTLSHWAKT